MPKRLIIGGLVIIIAIAIGVAIRSIQKPKIFQDIKLQKINIAVMPYSFTGYPIFLAHQKGYFKDQGLDVSLQSSYAHGMAILEAVTSGEAQIAASSETPFMNTILKGAKICVIATTVTANRHLAIIARKDKGIISPQDLRNKTIGVTMGSNGEYFLDMVLQLNGLSMENIKPVNLKPYQMVETIIDGKVDAIATWNPQKFKAQKVLGKNGVTFDADELYSPLFVIVASQSYVKSNPEMIRKVLKAIYDASLFIIKNPTESYEIVSKEIQADAETIKEFAATYRFKLSLEQSLITTLENQAYWAIKNKLKTPGEIPNFLESIHVDALEKIVPENVTIIR
jgi:ABC-type nitrate/sulfonate/bicarbonate transport system substrate-binding protein